MRNYKKKDKKYVDDDLVDAAQSVLRGEKSEHKAIEGKKFSRSLLRAKISELNGFTQKQKRGRKRCLSEEAEMELLKLITDMADAGFAPNRKQILSIVIEYCTIKEIRNPQLKRNLSPSKQNKSSIWRPTKEWLVDFMKRRKLSEKRTKGMHLGRYRNIKNPFLINNFYELLERTLDKLGIRNRPECIWNLDESGFPLDPNNTKTVSMVGQKVVKVVAGTGRENITVLAACNALGEAMPPLIIYESKAAILNSIPYEWLGDSSFTLPGTWYSLSKNGWMTTTVFEDWFQKFAEKTKETRPLLLLLDGHVSHLSQETSRRAAAENITILKLPSHTTSKLQPLDIAVFGPLKTYWTDQMSNWIMSTGIPLKAMTKKQFVNNLSQIWFRGLSQKNVKAGFSAVGIYPFNPDKYDRRIFDPELIKKYDRWVGLGKPDEMPEEIEADAPLQIDVDSAEERRFDYEQPPPPVDVFGRPRQGFWVWHDSEPERINSAQQTPASSSTSFLDIVSKRLNQSTPSTGGPAKRGKRIDMNAIVVTHEEITETAHQSSVTPKRKPKMPEPQESESDESESSLSSEDDIDESSESETDNEDDQNRQDLNWTNLMFDSALIGKLFAVHFDRPRKYYLGRHVELQSQDMVVFDFLDYRGSGQFFPRTGAPSETVPMKNVFYGPIVGFELIKGNGYLICDKELKEIQTKWSQFCKKLL